MIVKDDSEPLTDLLRIRELLDVSQIPDSISRRDLLSRTVNDSRRGKFSSGDFEHLVSDVDSPLRQSRGAVGRLDLGDSCFEHRDSISWSDGREEERFGRLIGIELLDVLLSRFDLDELDRPNSDLADLDAGPFGMLQSDVVMRLEVSLSTPTKPVSDCRARRQRNDDVQLRWCSFRRLRTWTERRRAFPTI